MSDATPVPAENQGSPAPRIDARLKVTGGALYAADMPVNDALFGVLATSQISRGTVTAVHVESARAVPGVVDVVTYGDVDALKRPSFGNASYTSLGPLHDRTIWHDGQIVALVVGSSFEAAQEGADKIRCDYQTQAASAHLDSEGVDIVPAKGNSTRVKENPAVGDFASAFDAASVKIDAEYHTPTQSHNPMELFSTTAVWQGDQLTIYEPSQNVYGFRAELARELNMDPANVRVLSHFVGGGFGSKGPMTPRTAIVALAARRLNRPVRCIVSRRQAYTVQPYRAPTRQRVRLGAEPNGKITAFSHEGWELTSRLDNYAVGGTHTTALMYDYGAVATNVMLVKADRQTPAFMRSPPELPYMFGLESAIDELAIKLRMDPVELRRINDTTKDPVHGKPYTSRQVIQCFEAAAKAFNWSRRNPEPGSMQDGDWLIGMGCAMACYPTNVAAATARVRLRADGHVRVQSASHELGTGIRTVAGQMAAEQLGVDMSQVQVETGDTDLPPAPVSGGSNSTASVCSAVLLACRQIQQKLFQAAARSGTLAGKPVDELRLRGGNIVAPDGTSLSMSDVFRTMGSGALEEYAEFIPEGAPKDAIQKLYDGTTSMAEPTKRPKVQYAFGAEFVEVRINRYTRELRVPRLCGAFSAGRIMNTRTARSQLMGGLIWGMSSALLESTEVDSRNARYVNRDLQDYYIPVNADVDGVQVIMLPEIDDDVNPAGVKGIGELGNVGTNAAVANAVFHATGKRIRRLPIRLEDLLV